MCDYLQLLLKISEVSGREFKFLLLVLHRALTEVNIEEKEKKKKQYHPRVVQTIVDDELPIVSGKPLFKNMIKRITHIIDPIGAQPLKINEIPN